MSLKKYKIFALGFSILILSVVGCDKSRDEIEKEIKKEIKSDSEENLNLSNEPKDYSVTVQGVLNYMNDNNENTNNYTTVDIEKRYSQKTDKEYIFVKINIDDFWEDKLYLVETKDNKIISLKYIGGGNKEYLDYDVVDLTQGTYVAYYSASNMGNGDLHLVSLEGKNSEYTILGAVDYHMETPSSTEEIKTRFGENAEAYMVYNNGILKDDYYDINGDGYIDIELNGTEEAYVNSTGQSTYEFGFIKETKVTKHYIYNVNSDEFVFLDKQD